MKSNILCLLMSLGLLAACNGDDTTTVSSNPPGATTTISNYTKLVISGDINQQTAKPGDTLTYKAIGFTQDNQESDLTQATTWDVVESQSPLKPVKPGVFSVEAGHSGPYTIQAIYPNNSDKIAIESRHKIIINEVNNDPIVIKIYPQDTLNLTYLKNGSTNYQFSIKGFDQNNNNYTLNKAFIKWSVTPQGSGASIDESSGYLTVKSDNTFIVKAIYNNIESSSTTVVAKSIATATSEPTVASSVIMGAPDQIFYINATEVKSCPVSSLPSIDSAVSITAESNMLVGQSSCSAYNMLGITKDSRLLYDSKYNKVYTFANINNKGIIYSIDPVTHNFTSQTESYFINDMTYSKSDNVIYILSSIFYPLGVDVDRAYTGNTIYRCNLSSTARLGSSCEATTSIIPVSPDNDGATPLDRYTGEKNYLVNYNDKYLYIFNTFYGTAGIGQTESRNFVIVSRCDVNGACYSDPAFDTTKVTSPYFDKDTILSKPSILPNGNNSYIYSIGVKLPSDAYAQPKALKINDTTAKLALESSGILIADIGYTNPYNINTYDNIAIDEQHKWVYYGDTTTDNDLSKCSYANNQINPDNGSVMGDCLRVTNFDTKDMFAGITFIPGNTINLTTQGLANLFFISKSKSGSSTSYIVAKCAKIAEDITEKNCFKYAIPNLNATSKLVVNRNYPNVYVISDSNIIYSINSTTGKVTAYNTDLTKVKAMQFSLDNKYVYLLGTNALNTLATLNQCSVGADGSITKLCSSINPILKHTSKLTNFDITNYKDKYLYLMLNASIYKCTLIGDELAIGECGIIKAINPTDNIDYNLINRFTKFSGIHTINANTFMYIATNTSTNKYIWPALIKSSSGELALNPANVKTNSDANLISNSLNESMGNLLFNPIQQNAYLGFPGIDNILACSYDINIATTGTIDLHGNRGNCYNVSSFVPYNSIDLVQLSN